MKLKKVFLFLIIICLCNHGSRAVGQERPNSSSVVVPGLVLLAYKDAKSWPPAGIEDDAFCRKESGNPPFFQGLYQNEIRRLSDNILSEIGTNTYHQITITGKMRYIGDSLEKIAALNLTNLRFLDLDVLDSIGSYQMFSNMEANWFPYLVKHFEGYENLIITLRMGEDVFASVNTKTRKVTCPRMINPPYDFDFWKSTT